MIFMQNGSPEHDSKPQVDARNMILIGNHGPKHEYKQKLMPKTWFFCEPDPKHYFKEKLMPKT